MRHLKFLTIITLVMPVTLIAQDFGNVGTEWHYSRSKFAGAQPNSAYRYIQSTKDTVIQGQRAYKLTKMDVNNEGDTARDVLGYVYQAGDTVKMYREARGRFINFWIKDPQEGDTLTLDAPYDYVDTLPDPDSTYQITITNIDTITVDGVKRKQYETESTETRRAFAMGTFIAGIGKRYGFLPDDRRTQIPETADGPIRCFSNDAIAINFTDTTCRYLKTPEITPRPAGFVSDGSEWYYSTKVDWLGPDNAGYWHIQYAKDTLLKGKEAHKLTVQEFNYKDTFFHDPVYTYETIDTIWMYSRDRERYITYWVKGLAEGDQVTLEVPDQVIARGRIVDPDTVDRLPADTTYQLTVDTVERVGIDGVPAMKRYETTRDRDSYYKMRTYIQGIGHTQGLFPREGPVTPETPTNDIRCYRYAVFSISFKSFACDYVTGAEAPLSPESFAVYPNPVKGQLNLDIPANRAVERATLRTLKGQIVKQTDGSTVDMKALAPGLYVVSVTFRDGRQVHKKVLKE